MQQNENRSAMMRNNILILCPIYAPYGGGGGQYFPLLVNNLKKTQIFNKIVIVTEYHNSHKLIEVSERATIFRIIPKRDSLENKSFIYSVFSFLCAYTIILLMVPILAFYYRVSIFQFTRYYYRAVFLVCYFLRSICKIKTVMDIRTSAERDMLFAKSFGVDAYLSISENITKQLIKSRVDKTKIFQIPNVIEFPNEEPSLLQDNVVDELLGEGQFMLFVGQLIERKSIFEVLGAFKLYRAINPGIRLVLIGRDMHDLKSKGLLETSDGIVYLGEQSRELVLAFIRRSSLVLQPSKLEGISRVALESLYYGKKILLPNCIDEFVRSNPHFVPKENTVESIFEKIKELMVSDASPIYDLDIHNPVSHRKKLSQMYRNILID